MKCKCGNNMDIKMAARVACEGCDVLTSMTTIITAQCNQCRAKFQVPVSSGDYIIQKKK